MSVVAYVSFNGNCEEALDFYAESFKTTKTEIMRWKDAPADPNFELPDSARELVMHSFLNICDGEVMFSDVPPNMPVTIGDNIGLTVISKSIDDIKYYFDKVKNGGTIIMELQETFWTKCYGSVKDKFGIMWQFSLDEEK